MSAMEESQQTKLQAKFFDFALVELVRKHRDSFQPLWTVDSWVKFLIWISLNCGIPGDKKNLENFADALGSKLTIRMRKIFFERILEKLALHLIADPSDPKVLVMSLPGCDSFTYEKCLEALELVGLKEKVTLDFNLWESHDQLIAIPWISAETGC